MAITRALLPFASAVAKIRSQAGDSLAGEIFFGPPRGMTNKLFYGDNLDVLRQQIKDESVNLVCLDPPINSNASYNLLFKSPSGEKSQAQIEAFEGAWRWNMHAARAFDEVLTGQNDEAASMPRAIHGFLGENDMMA